MSAFPLPWDFALILLILAVIVPWRGAVKMRQLFARPHLDTADRLALYASTMAFQWITVAVVLWRAQAHNLSLHDLAIALPSPPLIIAAAVGLSFVLLLYQLAGLRRFARLPNARGTFLFHMATKILPQNLVESMAFSALVGTVAICEEILYRGFVLVVIANATHGSLFAGAFVSTLFFAVAHAYQGRRGIMLTFMIGLLFAVVRLWTGSLIPSMAAHLFTDLVAGLAAPRVLKQAWEHNSLREDHPQP